MRCACTLNTLCINAAVSTYQTQVMHGCVTLGVLWGSNSTSSRMWHTCIRKPTLCFVGTVKGGHWLAIVNTIQRAEDTLIVWMVYGEV